MKAPTKLTVKQEIFAQKVVELANASLAYRVAYPNQKCTDKTVNEAASRLLKNSKVAARVKELRAALEKRHQITVDDLIKELEESRAQACSLNTPQMSAAISATMGKAKMLGFLVDKVEHSGRLTLEQLPDAEIDARLDEVMKRRAAA